MCNIIVKMLVKEFVVLCLFLVCGCDSERQKHYLSRRRLKYITSTSSTTTPAPTPPPFEDQILQYERNANASKVLQKDDRKLMNTWADEYLVKRLDVSLRYRMQMVKHEEHSFRIDGNVKWMKCLSIHRKDIRRSKRFYHDNELECLRISTSSDAAKKDDVEALEKEIIKWRKGYRHLVNLCDSENPTNTANAQQCLVEYMQNDKYYEVIERLMILKQAAVSDMYAYYNASLIELEECLKIQLSRYLERVRALMDALNTCYSITAIEKFTTFGSLIG